MKRKENKASLMVCDDAYITLATAIVYSGIVDKDVPFFRSNWAKTVFGGIGIDEDPLAWYNDIMRRKRSAKHGNRCS